MQYTLQITYQDCLSKAYSGKKLNALGLIIDKEKLIDHRFKERLKIRVQQIASHEAAKKTPLTSHADFYISCYLPYHSSIDIDDTVSLHNILIKEAKTVSLADNQSFFDYLIKENIAATVFVDNKITIIKSLNTSFSYKRWLWHIRQKLLTLFKQKLSKRSFDYFSLIFLGHKQILSRNELTTMFNHWGLSHYLARSGLHIVLFVLIWQFILNLLPLAIFVKSLFLLGICVLYALMSWSSLSFYRAFFVFLLTQSGKLINQQITYIHLASFLGLAFLLFNPMNLFFLDFQLSYGLTALLIFISWINQKNKKPTIDSPNQVARA